MSTMSRPVRSINPKENAMASAAAPARAAISSSLSSSFCGRSGRAGVTRTSFVRASRFRLNPSTRRRDALVKCRHIASQESAASYYTAGALLRRRRRAFQLIQLPPGQRVLRIELNGLFQALDRGRFVVLFLLRLRQSDVGSRGQREVLEVQLKPRQRLVGLVGVGRPLRVRDETPFAEIVGLGAEVLLAQILVLRDGRRSALFRGGQIQDLGSAAWGWRHRGDR